MSVFLSKDTYLKKGDSMLFKKIYICIQYMENRLLSMKKGCKCLGLQKTWAEKNLPGDQGPLEMEEKKRWFSD